jgi:hypothetical protein
MPGGAEIPEDLCCTPEHSGFHEERRKGHACFSLGVATGARTEGLIMNIPSLIVESSSQKSAISLVCREIMFLSQ